MHVTWLTDLESVSFAAEPAWNTKGAALLVFAAASCSQQKSSWKKDLHAQDLQQRSNFGLCTAHSPNYNRCMTKSSHCQFCELYIFT